MIYVSKGVYLDEAEIELVPIRAQGPGGQNVNKTSSAIQLRFDIRRSSLPDFYKSRLLRLPDQRVTKDGVLVLKAQQFRTQGQNRDDAVNRLVAIIQKAAIRQKRRKKTKLSASAKRRRVDKKVQRGRTKALRSKIKPDD